MKDAGVYAVARSVWEHEAFQKQKYTQREAWLWLIGAAVWKERRVNIEGRWVTLERGELSYSLRFLAKRWKWSKDAVSRFFLLLKNEDMIRDTSRDGSKVYSINNYNDFQVVGLPERDTERDDKRDTTATAPRHDRDKEEALQTLEEETVVKKEAPKAPSPSKPPVVIHSLPEWLDLAAWSGFCEMRRKIKHPLTDRAQELNLAKLERWRALGHDPTEILDHSTENSYRGLFEPKPNGTRHGRNSGPTAHENFAAGALDAAEEFARGNRS